MTSDLRIVIAADNMLARAGLAAVLASLPDCDIIAQTTLDDLADNLLLDNADVLLVDTGWQITNTLDHLANLDLTDIPVVVLINDEDDGALAVSALARFERYGVLLSEIDPDTLLLALRTVTVGLLVIDPALSAALHTPITADPIAQALTPREDEVLQLLAQGLTNKAIAHQLGITDHTVKFHVNAIMTKLGAQSRTEAVVLATRAGLIIL